MLSRINRKKTTKFQIDMNNTKRAKLRIIVRPLTSRYVIQRVEFSFLVYAEI